MRRTKNKRIGKQSIEGPLRLAKEKGEPNYGSPFNCQQANVALHSPLVCRSVARSTSLLFFHIPQGKEGRQRAPVIADNPPLGLFRAICYHPEVQIP